MQNLIKKSLKKRYKKELFFKLCAKASVVFTTGFLLMFFAMIFVKGNKAFQAHKILLNIDLTQESIIKNSELEKKI